MNMGKVWIINPGGNVFQYNNTYISTYKKLHEDIEEIFPSIIGRLERVPPSIALLISRANGVPGRGIHVRELLFEQNGPEPGHLWADLLSCADLNRFERTGRV